MTNQTIKILSIGLEPSVAGHLQGKGFPIKLYSFAEKTKFCQESPESKILFVKWDGGQKQALQTLEQIRPIGKKNEPNQQSIFLLADKVQKDDKLLNMAMKQYAISDVYSLTGDMHKIEMRLFELTGKLDDPDQATPYVVPEFLPLAFHEPSRILNRCQAECSPDREGKRASSYFFFAPNPDLARSGAAILKKIGCKNTRDFSEVNTLATAVALEPPHVLMVFHETNSTSTQILLDRIASIRKQTPRRIQIICPGEMAKSDFESTNRSSWFDQAIICSLSDSGFKEALESLAVLDVENDSPRAMLLDLRQKVQNTTVNSADENTQYVWKLIVKVAELPGRRYWAKLEHMYFFLAGGSNKKALEEVIGLLEMNPDSVELQLVKLNLLSTLGRDFSEDFKRLMENFARVTFSSEDLIALTRFSASVKNSAILQACLQQIDTASRKDDAGFHYMNAVYAGMIGDKSSEGHWLRSTLYHAPNRLLFLSKMGQYLSERRDYREAIKYMELCKRVAPEKRVLFDLMIADFLFSEGARMRSEQKLIEVLKEFPDNKMGQQLAKKLFPDTYEQLITKYCA